MTVSILETLGTLPSGKVLSVSPEQLRLYLVSKYRGRAEDDRRKETVLDAQDLLIDAPLRREGCGGGDRDECDGCACSLHTR